MDKLFWYTFFFKCFVCLGWIHRLRARITRHPPPPRDCPVTHQSTHSPLSVPAKVPVACSDAAAGGSSPGATQPLAPFPAEFPVEVLADAPSSSRPRAAVGRRAGPATTPRYHPRRQPPPPPAARVPSRVRVCPCASAWVSRLRLPRRSLNLHFQEPSPGSGARGSPGGPGEPARAPRDAPQARAAPCAAV